jgi:hypothetical protein
MQGMRTLPRNPADLSECLLATDPVLRALTETLYRQQRRLKRAIASEHYRLYLLLEETTNERCSRLAERVWAVAREQGRRASGRHRAPS